MIYMVVGRTPDAMTPTTLVVPFRLGACFIQPALNRISRGNTTVQVEPKMMQVLVYLAEHPYEVIPRETILQQVWHDTVVGEEVLSRSISTLRKALGDDARAPTFIETIPKTGYRLIAPITYLGQHGDQVPDPLLSVGQTIRQVAGPTTKRTYTHWVSLSIGVLVIAMGIAWAMRPTPTPSARATMPLTSFPGQEFDPALSPDGSQLAFIWSGGRVGHINVYVKVVGTETPHKLTHSNLYEFSPAWSPDGRQIAFARSGQGLFTLSPQGGPERKLTDIARGSTPDVAWSPRSDVLAYTDRASAESPYQIFLLSLETLEKRQLTSPPQHMQGDRVPAFSPDGRQIAFVRDAGRAQDVYITSIAGEEPRRITTDDLQIDGVTWTEDGKHLLFASNRGGRFALWQVSPQGEDLEPLALSGPEMREPAVGGGQLAYTQSIVENNIWRIESGHPQIEAETHIASSQWDSHPQYAPDGQRIAFASSRSGHPEIWISDAAGQNLQQLTHFDGPYTGMPRWSPDGKRLAFVSAVEGQMDVYTLMIDGGIPERITTSPAADIVSGWSPDGAYVYVGSNRSGRWQIWKISTAAEPPVQVTQEGGMYAFAATKNGQLYYTKVHQPGIWTRDIATGEESVVVENLAGVHRANWAILDDGIYFVNRAQNPASIDHFRFSDGLSETVAFPAKEPVWNEAGFTISPRDKTILYTQLDHSNLDIMIVDNFR